MAAVDVAAACCDLCARTPGCAAWTALGGASCPFDFAFQPAAQCFLKPNTAGRRAHPGLTSGTASPLPPPAIPLAYYSGANASAAAALAASFDAVVIVAATPAQEPQPGCEGNDRATLALPPWQDALITAVAAVTPNIVVVTRTGGAALMPWLEGVAAVVHMGPAGQEAGNALADVLLGQENPSGKLTISFPASDTATWLTTPQQYPGIFNASGDGFWQTSYSEGLFVGYRYYDAQREVPGGVAPLFPFGHGLSYSTFMYFDFTVSGAVGAASNATLTVRVVNAAGPAGRETAQLYLSAALPGDPPKSLKGFAGTGLLPPGESAVLSFTLTAADCAVYSVESKAWVQRPAGAYAVFVGASSVDIRLVDSVTVS